jgi:hypothetical protein|tara:strand:+ start:2440 stop:2775 length:336 start_codon:yes stop_codon:yes gene_type:complete
MNRDKCILIFLYLFLAQSIYILYKYDNIPIPYILIIGFPMVKALFDYRVCSMAYLECKVRDIKREDSLVNKFLDPMVDLRYSNHIYPLFIISFTILYISIVRYLKTYVFKL